MKGEDSKDHGQIRSRPLLERGKSEGHKADTCLLLKLKPSVLERPAQWSREDWEVQAFGEDADQKAHDLPASDKDRVMFFKDFKMELYSHFQRRDNRGDVPKVKPSIGIELPIPVRSIFAIILEEIKNEAIGPGGRITTGMRAKISSIHWQITHPANLRTEAQQVMRLAAQDAGIKSSHTGPSTILTASCMMIVKR